MSACTKISSTGQCDTPSKWRSKILVARSENKQYLALSLIAGWDEFVLMVYFRCFSLKQTSSDDVLLMEHIF